MMSAFITKALARAATRAVGYPTAARVASRIAYPTARFPAVRSIRSVSTAARLLKKTEVVKEDEVPVSVYTPDAKGVGQANTGDHYNLPVNKEAEAQISTPPQELEVADEKVVPLGEAAYKAMTPTMQKMSVKGKVAIVTGGARGLGNHMARALVEGGVKALAIFDANQELGDAAAEELHMKSGIPVSFFKVDVRDHNAVTTAVESAVKMFGVPDIMVNSAGIADSNIPAETYDVNMFRRLIDINLNGSFLVSQAVGRHMIAANKPGSIILVASMSGSIVNYPQEQSAYNASKAGVIQFSKSLAAEWAKYGIRVNTISPGYMDTALNKVPALDAQKKIWTGLTPQARLGAVDDLNGLCVFLASDASAFMTGSDVIIDGGYTLY